MKIIDRNGRLFGKISVIDVLVIAVVLVMAAALFFKNNQAHSLSNVFFVFKCNLERARVFPLA